MGKPGYACDVHYSWCLFMPSSYSFNVVQEVEGPGSAGFSVQRAAVSIAVLWSNVRELTSRHFCSNH